MITMEPRERPPFAEHSQGVLLAVGIPHLLSCLVLTLIHGKMELLPHFSCDKAEA